MPPHNIDNHTPDAITRVISPWAIPCAEGDAVDVDVKIHHNKIVKTDATSPNHLVINHIVFTIREDRLSALKDALVVVLKIPSPNNR